MGGFVDLRIISLQPIYDPRVCLGAGLFVFNIYQAASLDELRQQVVFWVPYELPPQTAERRAEVTKILLKVENRRSFLDLLVNSDEKWIF